MAARGWIERREGKRGVSYRVRWRAVDDDGVERTHSATVTTADAAETLLQIKLGEVASGLFRSASKATLRELVTRYLELHGPDLAPATRAVYGKRVNLILDPLGDLPLARITTARLQAVVVGLRKRYAPSTIINGWAPVRGALKRAAAWGLIAADPAIGVAIPGAGRAKPRAWTAEETARFLAAEGNEPRYGLVWRLMLATGVRKGEIAALHWEDVNLGRGELLIHRTMTVDGNGKRVLQHDTKTHRPRAIAIPASLVAALKAHHKATAERRLAAAPASFVADLVFVTYQGTPIDETLHRQLANACRRAGVPHHGLHGLRHTYATLELEHGTPPKIVQERLGHSTIAMTLDTYSHVSADLQRAAAERFDAFLGEAEAAERERRRT